MSGTGDTSGNGLADLVVAATQASGEHCEPWAGRSYVVFGKADGESVSLARVRVPTYLGSRTGHLGREPGRIAAGTSSASVGRSGAKMAARGSGRQRWRELA